MWGRRRARIAPGLLALTVAVGAAGHAQAAITISGTNAPVDEGGTTNVTVTRDSGLFETSVTVRLSGTGDAPAACPQDASVTAGRTCQTTVQLGSTLLGPVSQQVAIAVPKDGVDELDEMLEVELAGNGEIGTPSSKTLTIKDKDDPPALTIADAANVVEGDAAGAVLEFPVKLSAASALPVSAKVTLGGSATPNGDVVPSGFTDTYTVPAGTTDAVLRLAVAPDDLDELDEDVTVTLGPLTNATAGASVTAKGTIVNDDVPVVSIADAVTTEGTGVARTPLSFVVTLSNPSVRTVAVSANSADLQARAGQDYDAVAQRVTFGPGVTTQTVVAGVIADAVREDAEAFLVDLSDPSGVTLGRAGAIGGISDDDRAAAPGVVGTGGGSVVVPGAGTGGGAAGTTTGKLKLSKLTFARPATLRGTLACPAASRGCKGRITVFSVPQRKSKIKALRRELKLGTIAFDVAAGQAKAVRLRLSKKLLATIKRGKQVDVKAFAVSRTPAGEVSTADAKGVVKP